MSESLWYLGKYGVCFLFHLPRTDIEWYPGKCLTQKILKKKPKKGSKNAKPITKTEICESFFNFFSPPQVPEDEDELDEDMVSHTSFLLHQTADISQSPVWWFLFFFTWTGWRATEPNGKRLWYRVSPLFASKTHWARGIFFQNWIMIVWCAPVGLPSAIK